MLSQRNEIIFQSQQVMRGVGSYPVPAGAIEAAFPASFRPEGCSALDQLKAVLSEIGGFIVQETDWGAVISREKA